MLSTSRIMLHYECFIMNVTLSLHPNSHLPSTPPTLTTDLNRNPPDTFSVGLSEDENIYNWELMIMGPGESSEPSMRVSFSSDAFLTIPSSPSHCTPSPNLILPPRIDSVRRWFLPRKFKVPRILPQHAARNDLPIRNVAPQRLLLR